jgi:hypothetical protein
LTRPDWAWTGPSWAGYGPGWTVRPGHVSHAGPATWRAWVSIGLGSQWTRGAGLWTAGTVYGGPCPLSPAVSRLTMDQDHRTSSLLPPLHLLYSRSGASADGELACLHATATRLGRQRLLWSLRPRPSQRWGSWRWLESSYGQRGYDSGGASSVVGQGGAPASTAGSSGGSKGAISSSTRFAGLRRTSTATPWDKRFGLAPSLA